MDNSFLLSLHIHTLPIEQIEEKSYNIGDVPFNMFDDNIIVVASFNTNDYRGSSYCIYEFDNYYFYISVCYGSCSGCDEWIDNSSEKHESCIQRILSNLNPVRNLWEIDLDDFQYSYPTWREIVSDLMTKHNCLDKFKRHQEKILECQHAKEIEDEQKRETEKEIEDEQKREIEKQKNAEKKREIEESIVDLVDYFKTKSCKDPYFIEKATAKRRQLKYFTDLITSDFSKMYQYIKKEAEEILIKH